MFSNLYCTYSVLPTVSYPTGSFGMQTFTFTQNLLSNSSGRLENQTIPFIDAIIQTQKKKFESISSVFPWLCQVHQVPVLLTQIRTFDNGLHIFSYVWLTVPLYDLQMRTSFSSPKFISPCVPVYNFSNLERRNQSHARSKSWRNRGRP